MVSRTTWPILQSCCIRLLVCMCHVLLRRWSGIQPHLSWNLIPDLISLPFLWFGWSWSDHFLPTLAYLSWRDWPPGSPESRFDDLPIWNFCLWQAPRFLGIMHCRFVVWTLVFLQFTQHDLLLTCIISPHLPVQHIQTGELVLYLLPKTRTSDQHISNIVTFNVSYLLHNPSEECSCCAALALSTNTCMPQSPSNRRFDRSSVSVEHLEAPIDLADSLTGCDDRRGCKGDGKMIDEVQDFARIELRVVLRTSRSP
jgi:hypothetical protein